MKILIDIDKETYKEFTDKNEYILSDSVTRMAEALQNGIIVEEDSLIVQDITKITYGDMIKAKYPNHNWWLNEDNEIYTDLKDDEIVEELRDILKDSTRKRIYFDLDWWNKKIINEGE